MNTKNKAKRILKKSVKMFRNKELASEWLRDNRNRILLEAAGLAEVKIEFESERIETLAVELVKQSKGIVSEDTVSLCGEFFLSDREYDVLPAYLKLFLLEYILEAVETGDTSETDNAVKSLVLFNEIDFEKLRHTVVKAAALLAENADYQKSDVKTKALYRKKISELSAECGMDENLIAEKAVALGLTQALFGRLNTRLLAELNIERKPFSPEKRLFCYILVSLLLCAVPVACFALKSIALGIVMLIPLFTSAVGTVNRFILKRVKPRELPCLKDEYGDIPQNKCVVCYTVLFSGLESVNSAASHLEECYASNEIKNGVFLLLADLKGSRLKSTPEDKELIEFAQARIRELNNRYGKRFSLIIRHRVKQDNAYCGWERKRGAIEQLVRRLTAGGESFLCEENTDALLNSVYICTLDSDTVVPPGQLIKLLCTISHPACGYGLIQPYIGVLPKNRTPFARLFAFDCGIDGYSFSIGEINNDFFGCGTFCGKGIFSVKEYKNRVLGKIQPNTVLSHDIIEGELIKTALAGNIAFLDEFPADAILFYRRRERWQRGDWQNLPWLFSDIPAVSRWKIFYNLLQCLNPVFLLAQIIFATFAGGAAYAVFAVTFGELFLPFLQTVADTLFCDKNVRRDSRESRKNGLTRCLSGFCFLPLDATESVSAAAKGLFRRFISRKKVLEWTTFAQGGGSDTRLFLKTAVPIALFAAAALSNDCGKAFCLVSCLLWCSAPLISRLSGKKKRKKPLSYADTEILRLSAVRTVRFFYDSLAENGSIMPDNIQIKPYLGYAKRTSPTDMGFALLSVTCGNILGLYSPSLCAESLEVQIDVINSLPKSHGHLYNWYNTETRLPMSKYVSTVDSGNFCAAVTTVAGGLERIRSGEIICAGTFKAIGDVLRGCMAEADGQRETVDYYSERLKTENVSVLRELQNENKLRSVDGFAFLNGILNALLNDYYGLSFSDKIKAKIKNEALLNLLNSFPKPIDKILSDGDFIKKLYVMTGKCAEADEIAAEYNKITAYAKAINGRLLKIEGAIRDFLNNIDFLRFYDKDKKLFAVGGDEKPQKGCYDMLMSEARLTGYSAIAMGQIPAEHWFRLSRPFGRLYGMPICLSWGGTCFEYLMSDIFIKPREESMLYYSQHGAVKAQIANAVDGIWGISESAFYDFDRSGEYKYKAFGVPETAVAPIKNERVISPYSSLLCLEYEPEKCIGNLKKIVENGGAGKYGFYEALDFGKAGFYSPKVVGSFMAHHSGMGLCATVNFLFNGAVRECFLKSPGMRACRVLLDEKQPVGVTGIFEKARDGTAATESDFNADVTANDRQSAMLFASGDVISVQADTKGNVSLYDFDVFIGNVYTYSVDEGVRSIPFLPSANTGREHNGKILPESIRYCRVSERERVSELIFCDGNSTVFEITVENSLKAPVKKGIALALEPALCKEDAYMSHPAFNGLMIEATENDGVLSLFNRRTNRRVFVYAVEEMCEFATDACDVFGRGRDKGAPLIKMTGVKKYPVTPCACARVSITVPAEKSRSVKFVLTTDTPKLITGAAVGLALSRAKQRSKSFIDGIALSFEQWRLSLYLGMAVKQFSQKSVFAEKNRLWQLGIDHNIPLITIEAERRNKHFTDIITAAEYLFKNGVRLQLLVLDKSGDDYFSGNFRENEEELKRFSGEAHHIRYGAVRNTEAIAALSNAYISCDSPASEQLDKIGAIGEYPHVLPKNNPYPPAYNEHIDGKFDNGYGCFYNGGYYIYEKTPAPWINVLAEDGFGSVICENGGGYTFAGNSQLNKLTPFSNDQVENALGEAVYLRDNRIERFWSITREPVDLGDSHSVFYGKGYGIYSYGGFGLNQTQTVFVYNGVKVIRVEADMTENRDITAFLYCEPVVGEQKMRRFICAEEHFGALCAHSENGYMFVYTRDGEYCGDKSAFFGNGKAKNPYSVIKGGFLTDAHGEIALCVKVRFTGKTDFFIGFEDNLDSLKAKIEEIKTADIDARLERVKSKWEDICSAVTVKTPDERLNTLFNECLMYQTLSSRISAKCGFYQAGGAIGFRDQLQDCLALLYSQSELVRSHILNCAKHQFKEGDVMHWWHEPYLGVRTRISDDLLFLPFTASKYASVTGDYGIFGEVVSFAEGLELGDRDDVFGFAAESAETDTLYGHCMRAFRLCIKRKGAHGLPLILNGDWNDGFNKIGNKGKGESVWLGWFLYACIGRFIPVCERLCPEDKPELLREAKSLYKILNELCFDGDRFIRAFDDKLEPVGAAGSEECAIDSVAQSWAVLSGAGKSELCELALETAERELFDYDNMTVNLLSPPVSTKKLGYIGDYVPGVRENGGQYTHGAVWLASAFAQMGNGERCAEILDMLNPISHTETRQAVKKYRVEPYALAADVYSGENAGRGGWTWYTASSAMYFTCVLNDLLGIDFTDGKLTVSPHIPKSWREYSVHLERNGEIYEIKVLNPDGLGEGVKSKTEYKKGNVTEVRIIM